MDAALGILNGGLTINAANITGLISASQIDLNGVGSALANVSTFLTTMQNTVASNSQFLTNLFNSATTNPAFITALTNIFTSASNTTNNTALQALINALIAAELANSTFSTAIANAVTAALQDGSSLPAGVTTLWNIPDVSVLFPPPRNAQSATTPASTATTVTVQTTGTAPDTQQTSLQTVQTTPSTTIVTQPEYSPLPMAVIAPINQGTCNGELPIASAVNAGWYYTVAGSAIARIANRRRGMEFKDGAIVVSDGNQWFEAFQDSGSMYPKAFNFDLFTIPVRAEQLHNSTRFGASFAIALGLLGNATGEYILRLRTGTAQQTSGGGMNLSQITWDAPIIEERIIISAVPAVHPFGYTVNSSSSGVLTATKTLYGATGSAANPSNGANFVLKASLESFDVSNCADPRGAVSIIMQNARASIVTTS